MAGISMGSEFVGTIFQFDKWLGFDKVPLKNRIVHPEAFNAFMISCICLSISFWGVNYDEKFCNTQKEREEFYRLGFNVSIFLVFSTFATMFLLAKCDNKPKFH